MRRRPRRRSWARAAAGDEHGTDNEQRRPPRDAVQPQSPTVAHARVGGPQFQRLPGARSSNDTACRRRQVAPHRAAAGGCSRRRRTRAHVTQCRRRHCRCSADDGRTAASRRPHPAAPGDCKCPAGAGVPRAAASGRPCPAAGGCKYPAAAGVPPAASGHEHSATGGSCRAEPGAAVPRSTTASCVARAAATVATATATAAECAAKAAG